MEVMLFLLAVGLVIMFTSPPKSFSKPPVCNGGHKWEWPEDEDLFCAVCKRTAYEIMNGMEK